MEGLFIKSLRTEVERQGGGQHIEVVTSGVADAIVKVPPQHLIADRAARCVKTWLAQQQQQQQHK